MENPFNKWKILLKNEQLDSNLNDCTFVHKEQEQQQQRRSMDLRGEARGQKSVLRLVRAECFSFP